MTFSRYLLPQLRFERVLILAYPVLGDNIYFFQIVDNSVRQFFLTPYFFYKFIKVCQHGAWVENKGVLLTYHYREVPVEKRNDLIARAKKLIIDSGFKVSLILLTTLSICMILAKLAQSPKTVCRSVFLTIWHCILFAYWALDRAQ